LRLGPASPIIEDVEPLERGLNISWKSDVTSKQEKYVVVYVRNDTGRPTNIETIKPKIKLDNLYPGAGYEIKVSLGNEELLVFFPLLPYKYYHNGPKVDLQ
jgi:hypothetical protein